MPRRASRWIAWLSLLIIGVVAGWVAWRCCFDHAIRFLPRDASAEWIMYPMTPEISARPVAKPGEELSATFRRTIISDEDAGSARLLLRALETFAVEINGQPLARRPSSGNWKDVIEIDAGARFVRGSNQLSISVTNCAGPPLLWLVLNIGDQQLISDRSWEVSYADATPLPAHLATEPRAFGKGNFMRDDATVGSAWRRYWWLHAAFIATAALIAFVVDKFVSGKLRLTPSEAKYAALGVLILFWIITLIHNFNMLPPVIGFDAEHHSSYIRYIQEKGRLPEAGAGWETHQPPLYYFVAAKLLSIIGLLAASPEGLMGLRVLGLLMGLGQILLVFASLRLLFPGELRRPLLGAGMAALLPAHLYHAHYVTNETAFALLVSAAFYCALRILCADDAPAGARTPSFRTSVLLGVFAGGAMLAKLSALIFLPVLFAALLAHVLARRETTFIAWLKVLVVPSAVCLLVCGWYWWRVWNEGGPYANSSRWGYGTGWWQQDGYRTLDYYLRFGQTLAHPLYAGFHGFWDGLYSTLWGDALCGGAVSVDAHPPWNYELLKAGYWFALLPTLAVVVGFGLAFVQVLRRGSAKWLLPVGTTLLFAVAAVYFSLIAPGTSQVRSSFGLMLLVPFCAFFALGLERLISARRALRFVLFIIVIWWGLNSAAAHWIPSSSVQARVLRANMYVRHGHFKQALAQAEEGLRLAPATSLLRSALADSWNNLGKTNEARQFVMDALAKYPEDPVAHLDAAFEFARSNQLDEAIAHTRRALALAPDHMLGARQLVMLLCRAQRLEEALPACRDAVRLAPHDQELREWLRQLGEGKIPSVEVNATDVPKQRK